MAYRVMVGTYEDWHELPIGTEWLGWNQKRRQKLVKVPLGNGALDIADGLWEPMKVKLRICLYSTSPSLVQTELATVYDLLMLYQTENQPGAMYLAIENRAPSSLMVFLVRYDKVVGMDVAVVKRTRHRHCYATFTLSCHAKPFMNLTENTDGT